MESTTFIDVMSRAYPQPLELAAPTKKQQIALGKYIRQLVAIATVGDLGT